MNSRLSAVYVPSLSTDAREEIGKLLQATLVELLDLALTGKQLHWSITGPHFRPLHEQLDELVDSWHEIADTVAEREVTVGCWPDGQDIFELIAEVVAGSCSLEPGICRCPRGAWTSSRCGQWFCRNVSLPVASAFAYAAFL